jgi:hypothetical protein
VPVLQTFDEIPEAEAVPTAEVMEVEPKPMAPAQTARPAAPAQISKAPTSARPAAPASTARPATPAAPARPSAPAAPASPSKKPQTLEEILAALKDK